MSAEATHLTGVILKDSMSADHEERRLIEQAVAGDRRAFERLYRAHLDSVHGLCRRLVGRRQHMADDAVQETFVSAWRALPSFGFQSELGTWLHRIAVNVVLKSERPLSRRFEVCEGQLDERPERVLPDPLPPIDLELALQALPDGARHVVVLISIYGYTHQEVSALLGIAEGTSRAQLNRARRLLIERLGLETL
jgi:RNA polymerase sigma-70 factor (ECF subfamily)